jgi:hypothetical protein
MLSLKKLLLIVFLCFFFEMSKAYTDTVKSVVINLDKNYTISAKPDDTSIFSKYISPYIPVAVIIVTLFTIWWQIKARRRDDRLKNQLERLNKQISDLYGPLFTLYETGDQNFYIYLKHCGSNITFKNPHYNLWSSTVFHPTNLAMEQLIINKADLVLGKKVPPCFLSFCAWSTTRKVYIEAHKMGNLDLKIWEQILEEIEHPQIDMQVHLRATFEVLKEEQSRLLSGKRSYVDEKKLLKEIKRRTKIYKEEIEKEFILNDKVRSQVWDESQEIVNQNSKSSTTTTKARFNVKAMIKRFLLAYCLPS